MANDKATRKAEKATSMQDAGAAIASMYGAIAPVELSNWFTQLFPGYSSGQDWENFKLGYMTGLWSDAEELAAPVFVADTNPDEHRITDAVGFMTLAYITTREGGNKLELLDRHNELMPGQA
jgi:hypothetical protein